MLSRPLSPLRLKLATGVVAAAALIGQRPAAHGHALGAVASAAPREPAHEAPAVVAGDVTAAAAPAAEPLDAVEVDGAPGGEPAGIAPDEAPGGAASALAMEPGPPRDGTPLPRLVLPAPGAPSAPRAAPRAPWEAPPGLLSALVEGQEAMPEGQPTPLASEQIGRLLAQAHRELYGVTPGPDRLLVAWAHASLEVSRGATCIEHNFINVVVSLRWRGSWHVRRVAENIDHDPRRKKLQRTRFRGYATPFEGALDYWRVLAGHFGSALKLFDQGEARAAGQLLCEHGFSTGSCEAYAQGLAGLYSELRGSWAYRLGTIMQPTPPEPMLPDDWERLRPVQGQDVCVLQSVSPIESLSR